MRRSVGRVVSIRVNPTDCMAVVDLVDKIGLHIPGMSFSQAVSIALSSAMESLRRAGAIPTRDGFEFSEMMQKYPNFNKGSKGKALDIARTFADLGSSFRPPSAVPESPAYNRAKIRFEELRAKAKADPDNMSAEEFGEYSALQQDFA